ncbi:MAG TPA: hypothetical protein VGL72_30730 [Bryobacteraceae bacterium]|jgi:hypothetical protein
MPQERYDSETARELAVQSLKNELEIATKLLKGVKEARETVSMESRVIDSARSAFRHAVDALDRVPQLAAEDMHEVQKLIEQFRSALADLE